MQFKRISDYIEGIDKTYFLSEYGDLYWRVKSYNGSYKVNLQVEGKSKQYTITKLIKPYLGLNITQEIMQDIWIIEGIVCSKRYLNPEKEILILMSVYTMKTHQRKDLKLQCIV